MGLSHRSGGETAIAKQSKKVRVAALGDLHMRESSSGTYRDLLASLSEKADILVVAGDLTDHGVPAEAEVVLRELEACTIPIVAVFGNHDVESGQQEELRRILSSRGVTILDGESCEIDGVGFAGTKGFAGGFDNHILQAWGEDLIKRFVYEAINESLRLERALARLRTERSVVVLHYAPIRQTALGEAPEILPFLGSSRLVEPIERFGATAVFHGHAHSGTLCGETGSGIPVYNVSFPLLHRRQPKEPYVVIEV